LLNRSSISRPCRATNSKSSKQKAAELPRRLRGDEPPGISRWEAHWPWQEPEARRPRQALAQGEKQMRLLSGLEYSHWLMVGGAVLVVLGFIGFAFRQNRNVEPDDEPTEREPKQK
jgi:hypothetical protein